MRTTFLYRSMLAVSLLLTPFAAAQQIVPGGAGIVNNAHPNATLPQWMKRGLRLTYFQGSASIPASRQVLVPGPNGGWVNSVTGQTYSVQDAMGAGGCGFTTMTFVAADEHTLAVATRMFLLIDPAQGRVTSSSTGAIVGTPDGLGETSLPPAKLAAMHDMHEGGVTIARTRYPLGGREYNALTMETRGAESFTRHVYDLDSGLLLVLSTSAVGNPVLAPNPDGTVGAAGGDTMITSTIFMNTRQLDLPWLNDARPNSIKAGARLDYDGTYSVFVPGSPQFPMQLSVSTAFGEGSAEWAPAKKTVRMPGPAGFPQESVSDEALGAATNLPTWVNPASVAQIARGRVLDEDPITKFRTISDGVQGNVFVVIEEGPNDRFVASYDLNSGLLVDLSHQQQVGVGQVQTHVRLAGLR